MGNAPVILADGQKLADYINGWTAAPFWACLAAFCMFCVFKGKTMGLLGGLFGGLVVSIVLYSPGVISAIGKGFAGTFS